MRQRGVILVGHGGIPTNYPRALLTKLRTLESTRRATGGEPSPDERALDRQLRQWPRTAENDPYQAGLEALAAHLKGSLNSALFAIAYNEFCTPTLEEAVEELLSAGANEIVVVPSMLTPGGSHSEIEIPEILSRLRTKHPGINLRYAWPFDLKQVAAMLAAQLARFPHSPSE